MDIQLTDYQVDAVEKMHNGCILRGNTGSGKTLTSLVHVFEKVLKGSSPLYPGHTYTRPKVNVPIYVITTPMKRDSFDWPREAALVPLILTQVDSWNNIKKYESIKNAIFIFDESKVIGYGAWTKSFLKITSNNAWVLLSATPGDTWLEYMPVFLANGFYKNKTEFEREHIIWSRFSKYPKVERYFNISRLIHNRDRIVIDMPDQRPTTQHHKDVICDFDSFQYDVLAKKRWNIFENKPVRDISQLCYLLRKLINSDESRLTALDSIFARHKKVIVFYNFDYELYILREWCASKHITYSEWNGHNHDPIPTSKFWVYLCQYTAAKEAWNCIETDCIVFYSQTYSYKALVQSAGRIDRMNTSFMHLYYYHLISGAPIEAAIQTSLTHKENFNEKRWLQNELGSQ
ncbi:MAG: DEAD/DEAH box helicase family protein [Alphaproteobacteria bacterium]|nr:DEAD/DEAH box helicase family protein [Alphaproteobacteria bacterium]